LKYQIVFCPGFFLAAKDFVIILMTPPTASEPYMAEEAPFRISSIFLSLTEQLEYNILVTVSRSFNLSPSKMTILAGMSPS
jgi:hypothetical protein